MNVLILKLIALTTMIIDHYGAIFQSDLIIFRIIGRLAFPIYCFLLVEGYFHTSDVKKYGKRLIIFALISEIPFDLAFYNKIGFIHQNIFFTLFIGLVTIHLLERKIFNNSVVVLSTRVLAIMVVISSCILAIIFSVDYNAIGIIYILSFYYSRNLDRFKKLKNIGIVMLIVNFTSSILQQFSLLALPIIYSYNGKLGPKNKILQTAFYAAYPLHLLIFYILK